MLDHYIHILHFIDYTESSIVFCKRVKECEKSFKNILALLVEDQVRLCDTLSSVVRPSSRLAVRLSVNNILFLYLLRN